MDEFLLQMDEKCLVNYMTHIPYYFHPLTLKMKVMMKDQACALQNHYMQT